MTDPNGGGLFGTRVLVTGARGFLGSHLCRALVGAGADVAAVSRTAHSGEPTAVRWWQCELEDFAQAEELVGQAQPDVIFHLGGRVSAAPDPSLVLPTFHSLLTTSVNLLTLAARRACRRVVFVGSLEEPYGAAAEDATPASPYGAAKWAAGEALSDWDGLKPVLHLPIIDASCRTGFSPSPHIASIFFFSDAIVASLRCSFGNPSA